MSSKTMRAGSVVLAVVCCAAIPACAQQNAPSPAQTSGIALYVATNGNDAWSGTQPNSNADSSDGPFATLQRARDAVRELRKSETGVDKPVTVTVRGGTYLLDETLIL